MTASHSYRVEGSRTSRSSEWELILTTKDPVKAMKCVHDVDTWFWRRLWEDDKLVLDRV